MNILQVIKEMAIAQTEDNKRCKGQHVVFQPALQTFIMQTQTMQEGISMIKAAPVSVPQAPNQDLSSVSVISN